MLCCLRDGIWEALLSFHHIQSWGEGIPFSRRTRSRWESRRACSCSRLSQGRLRSEGAMPLRAEGKRVITQFTPLLSVVEPMAKTCMPR